VSRRQITARLAGYAIQCAAALGLVAVVVLSKAPL
jgi:hypothetical protein